jgi:hypothetical protein
MDDQQLQQQTDQINQNVQKQQIQKKAEEAKQQAEEAQKQLDKQKQQDEADAIKGHPEKASTAEIITGDYK